MSEQIIEGTSGFTDVEKQNAETAQKLADQGKDTLTKPEDFTDTSSALDKLAAEVVKKPDPEPEVVEVDEAARKAAEEKAAADKVEADKVAAEKEASLRKAEEYFKDSPSLPAGASPKSSEAFSAIKIRAAQDISSRDTKIEELNKSLAELKEKTKNPLTPEVEKELKELREWRAKLDVDADPKFKEFDRTVSASHEFIYAQLRKSPSVTDKVIEEIKKYGGPENVNMVKLFESIKDPSLQRLVESKIADIEMAKFNKEQAVKAAKENVGQYMTERQKAAEAAAVAHNTRTSQYLGTLEAQLPWFAEKLADPKADEAGKKEIEGYNKFVKETKDSMAEALRDDSPEMRAIMIAGMAELFRERREKAAFKAEKVAADAKITTLEKTVEELNSKLARFKDASISRLRESGAPADGKLPVKKVDLDVTTPASQALDNLAREIVEKRQAAGK